MRCGECGQGDAVTQLELAISHTPVGLVARQRAEQARPWHALTHWLERLPRCIGRARIIVISPGGHVAALVRAPTVAAAAVRVEPLLDILAPSWMVVVHRGWATPWRTWRGTAAGAVLVTCPDVLPIPSGPSPRGIS